MNFSDEIKVFYSKTPSVKKKSSFIRKRQINAYYCDIRMVQHGKLYLTFLVGIIKVGRRDMKTRVTEFFIFLFT